MLSSDQTPRVSAPNKSKVSHTSRKNSGSQKQVIRTKKTHRHRGKYQLVECAARSRQPTLEGVAHHGLLIVLDIISDLEGGSPRDAGEFKDPGVTASDVSR
jgi:hypothetical protein